MTNLSIRQSGKHRSKRFTYLTLLTRAPQPVPIHSIARRANFPHVLLVRFAVEAFLSQTNPTRFGLPKWPASGPSRPQLKQAVRIVMSSPDVLTGDSTGELLNIAIEDAQEADLSYSHHAACTARHYGLLGEYKLQQAMMNVGCNFDTEDDLRFSSDVHKTPDIICRTPLLLASQPIYWIDSKSMFGSLTIHRKNVANQLRSYARLFGPGLVVYWCGIDARILTDPDCLDSRIHTTAGVPAGLSPMVPRVGGGIRFGGREVTQLDEYVEEAAALVGE